MAAKLAGLRVIYALGYAARMAGSQRSLAITLEELVPEPLSATVVLPEAAAEVVEEFEAVGATVEIITEPGELASRERTLDNVSPIRLATVALRDYSQYAARWSRLLRRLKPDIVHCNDRRALALVGPIARLHGIPVVWHARGVSDSSRRFRWALGLTRPHVVAVADAVRRTVPQKFDTTVVYNPFPAPPKQSHATGRDVRGLCASSPVPYKGVHHLIRALARLGEAGDPVPPIDWACRAATAHERRYLEDCLALARQLGVKPHFSHVGWRASARELYDGYDFLLLPTVDEEQFRFADGETIHSKGSEGFPRVVVEAMARGVVPIASRVAGVPEAVTHDQDGLLVAPGDVDGLAAALRRICDPEQRNRLASAAVATAQAYEPSKTASGLLEVYHRLTGLAVMTASR